MPFLFPLSQRKVWQCEMCFILLLLLELDKKSKRTPGVSF